MAAFQRVKTELRLHLPLVWRFGKASLRTWRRTRERLTGASRRAAFHSIYLRNAWGGTESLSGTGSDLTQTGAIREALTRVLRDFRITSLLDVACGDFHWMKEVNLRGIRYIGVDIVPELIHENRRRFSAPGREFRVLDLVRDRPPRVDLVVCRDCLVHLSNDNVKGVIRKLKQSRSTLLLTTTFPGRAANADITTGRWRPLNLQQPPFNFPPPLRLIAEGCTEEDGQWTDKSLGLWHLSDLPD